MSGIPLDPPPSPGVAGGLQHERTALAWERTAIAMMVAGVAMARYAAVDGHIILSVGGVAETCGGGALLYWAGRHDDQLHNPAEPVSAVPQLGLSRIVGAGTVAFTGMSLVLAILIVIGQSV